MVAQKRAKLKLHIGPNAVAPKFRPYLLDRSRHLLLWGGRDSTKSDFVALELLMACLKDPYFLCVMIREKQNTIADSQIATLKKVAERENIAQFFRFPQGPTGVLEVSCLLNKNKFIGRGTDDMDRMKSVSDPTCAWYEEANQIAKEDADVVSTTLRTSRPGAVIREIYSFNPDHKEDYKKFWIWKKFFDNTGHPDGTTFDGQLVVDVDGQLVRQSFRVLHSTAADNPWCPAERKATYAGYRLTDPYRYRVWHEGLWASRQTGNEFYPRFARATHAAAPVPYRPGAAIWQSWDANSLPYCAMLCAQTHQDEAGRTVLGIFAEYALRSPNSGLKPTAKQFLKDRQRLGWQSSAVWLTGDGTMRNRKVGEERETTKNDVVATLAGGFTDADGHRVPGCLHGDSDSLWTRKNPGVDRRRDFMNYLLAGGFAHLAVRIDPACAELIADLELTQKGVDGKVKEKFDDKVLGVKYEVRGHFGDVADYLCTTVFKAEWEAFKDGRDG